MTATIMPLLWEWKRSTISSFRWLSIRVILTGIPVRECPITCSYINVTPFITDSGEGGLGAHIAPFLLNLSSPKVNKIESVPNLCQNIRDISCLFIQNKKPRIPYSIEVCYNGAVGTRTPDFLRAREAMQFPEIHMVMSFFRFLINACFANN